MVAPYHCKPCAFLLWSILILASPLVAAASEATSSSQRRHGDHLTVDLGYGVYRGVQNSTSGLTVWKGIRFAAPPVGSLRWQAPREPAEQHAPYNETAGGAVISADAFGPVCPQQSRVTNVLSSFIPGLDEDCLFLNVYAPTPNDGSAGKTEKASLPVFVWIHGGGYGGGTGLQDMTAFLNTNGNRHVAVTIQYRLGAFGFLSSPEIKTKGVLNAGLLDQEFALKWVQRHIAKFGGDPRRATIGGLSAGGGSVMTLAIARDGKLGDSLFRNLIAASPYLPTQPYFDDVVSTDRYRAFAELAGCAGPSNVFECLVSKDSLTLQYANGNMTAPNQTHTPYGNWAFIPVTDGVYISEPATVRLNKSAVNGVNLLSGGNANEADLFVPTGITTEASLRQYIKSNFVKLSEEQVSEVLAMYPSVSEPDDPDAVRFETSGLGPATAVNVSAVATGHQQRAFNIYAEATFVCPAYWLADAFSTRGKSSFLYQYSIPFAAHGADYLASVGDPTYNQGPDFVRAYRMMYGNLISTGNPSIDNAIANGGASSSPYYPGGAESNSPASHWPRWYPGGRLLNLNQTGGVPTVFDRLGVNVTQFAQPGLRNKFTAELAYPWEGGRGRRCDFWRSLGSVIPQRR